MSRIGKRPIALNPKVDIEIENNAVSIEGPRGQLKYILSNKVTINKENNQIVLSISEDSKEAKALYGLSRTMVNNMIIGVSQGFCKTLQINGVGYKAQLDNQRNLILNIGYSHPVHMTPPPGIDIEVKNNTEINIKGINKETVGQFTAQIRSKRPPEPYKGKGIRYNNEIIRRKAGKAGK